MGVSEGASQAEGVEQAINRVLEAEAVALQAVEACRREAQGIVDGGRRASRRIVERADARIARVHAVTDRLLARRLAEIQAESARLSGRDLFEEADLARVRDALPQLAAELTGGEG
jgi:hypothetical protein